MLDTTGAPPSGETEVAGGVATVVDLVAEEEEEEWEEGEEEEEEEEDDGVLAEGAWLPAVLVTARPRVLDRVRTGCAETGGASRLPAEIGSEERPMC